jgi:hypothetical protein
LVGHIRAASPPAKRERRGEHQCDPTLGELTAEPVQKSVSTLHYLVPPLKDEREMMNRTLLWWRFRVIDAEYRPPKITPARICSGSRVATRGHWRGPGRDQATGKGLLELPPASAIIQRTRDRADGIKPDADIRSVVHRAPSFGRGALGLDALILLDLPKAADLTNQPTAAGRLLGTLER